MKAVDSWRGEWQEIWTGWQNTEWGNLNYWVEMNPYFSLTGAICFFTLTLYSHIFPIWYWSPCFKAPFCSLRCYGGKLLFSIEKLEQISGGEEGAQALRPLILWVRRVRSQVLVSRVSDRSRWSKGEVGWPSSALCSFFQVFSWPPASGRKINISQRYSTKRIL